MKCPVNASRRWWPSPGRGWRNHAQTQSGWTQALRALVDRSVQSVELMLLSSVAMGAGWLPV